MVPTQQVISLEFYKRIHQIFIFACDHRYRVKSLEFISKINFKRLDAHKEISEMKAKRSNLEAIAKDFADAANKCMKNTECL